MSVVTIRFFKWLAIFVALIAAVAVVIDVSNSIRDKLSKLPNKQQKIIDELAPATDGLDGYFPQMCTEKIIAAAERQGHETLGCYTFKDLSGENRWLVWLGKPDGQCTALMLSPDVMPVEITCEFAHTVYQMLLKMQESGDIPEMHFYSD